MSRNSLGTLTVDLLAKTGAFEEGMDRASRVAQRRAAEIDRALSKAGAAIGAAMTAGAAVVGAAVKQQLDHMDTLSKAAAKVQMPTEDLSKLAYAGELADVSLETLTKTLGKLTQNSAAALDSTSEQAKMFKALGIQVTDTNGRLRGGADLLADYADAYVRLGRSPEVAAAGFKIFGKSFQEVVPLIQDGGQAIRDAGDEAARFGLVVSTQAGKQAEQFNDDLSRLKMLAGSAAMTLANEFLPALVDISGETVDAASGTAGFADEVSGLASVLDVGADAFDVFGRAIKSLGIIVAGERAKLGDYLTQLEGVTTFGAVNRLMGNGAKYDQANARIGAVDDMVSGALGDTWNAPLFSARRAQALEERKRQEEMERRRRALGFDTVVTTVRDSRGRIIPGAGDGVGSLFDGSDKPAKGPKGKDAGKELERLAADQKRWREEIERTAAQLAGPLKLAEVEHAQRMAEIEAAYKEGRMTLETYNQAKELEVTQYEKTRAEIAESRDVMGKLQAEYAEQIRLAGLSGDAYEVEVEMLRRVNDAKRDGISLTEDQLVTMRKEIAAGQQRLRQLDEQQQAAQDLRSAWQSASYGISEAFGDWIGSGLKDTKNFATQARSIIRRLVSDLTAMLANKALTRWLSAITGQNNASSNGSGGGFWQSLLSAFSGSSGNGNGSTGGGFFSSIMRMFGMSGSTGSGATTGAASGGAGTAVMATAAIIAGMYLSKNWWEEGWRAEGQMTDLVKYPAERGFGFAAIDNAAVMGAHNLLTAIGLSDKWAAILSGSAGIARAWGMKKPKVTGSGITGAIGFDGFDGSSYADIKQRGGWFRSDRRWTQYSAIDGTVDRAFDSVSTAVRFRALDLAQMMGVDIASALSRVRIDLGKIRLDSDPEKARQQILEQLQRVQQQLSGEAIRALGFGRLLDDGFDATEQMTALAASIGLVSGSAQILGRSLTALEKENIARAVEWFEAQAMKDGAGLADTVERVTGQLSSYAGLISDVDTQIKTRGMNQFQQAQLQIELQYRSQVKQANDLAKALGLSGARAEDLAKIEQLRALGMADLQRQMEQAQTGWLTGLSLSELSPLTDAEKLNTALGELRKAAGAGDLQGAQQFAQQALQLGRGLYASGSDYSALYSEVTGLVGQVTASGLMGYTDTQLRIIADGITTLPEDIARAMFALLYKPVTVLPPPVVTPPPPIGQGGNGGNGPGGGGGPGDLRDVHREVQAVKALLLDIATTNRRMMTNDEAGDMRTIGRTQTV